MEELEECQPFVGPQGLADYLKTIKEHIFLINSAKISSPVSQLEIALDEEYVDCCPGDRFKIHGILITENKFLRKVVFSSKSYSNLKEAEQEYSKLVGLMRKCDYIMGE